jgi:hypothetical protein
MNPLTLEIYYGIPFKGKLNFNRYCNIEIFDYIINTSEETKENNSICGIKISSSLLYGNNKLYKNFDECKYYCKICGFDNLIKPQKNGDVRCNKCDFDMSSTYFYNINFICENIRNYGDLDFLPLYFNLSKCRDVENFIDSEYLLKYDDCVEEINDFIKDFALETLYNPALNHTNEYNYAPYFFYMQNTKFETI